MNFQIKLVFLVILANLLLCGVVWQLVVGAQTIKKNTELFIPATEYLQGISSVKSLITLQTKKVLDHLISRSNQDKQGFARGRQDIEKAFQLWRQSVLQQKDLNVEGEDDDLALLDDVYRDYQAWQKSMLTVVDLAEKGEWDNALLRYREKEAFVLEEEILPALDIALNDGLVEVESAYHGLLLAVGRVPWGVQRNAEQLEEIHINMDFMIAGNRLNASFNDQLLKLVNYLLYGHEKSLQKFYRSQIISEETLVFWSEVAERKELAASGDHEQAHKLVKDIRGKYQMFLLQANEILALKKSGQVEASLSKILEKNDHLITDFQRSTALAISEGADSLINRVSTFTASGIIILVMFFSAGSLLSLLVVKDMLASLKTLNSGMDIIQSGDLSHRMTLKKSDIVGKLALTFNSMMDSLCSSQESLKQLTLELEQRVDDRTAQLAATNKDLEAFNAMVSHDLRSPLTAVSGFSQLLLLAHSDNSLEETQELLEKLVTSSDSMSRMVSSLEALAKAGHKPLKREPVDLRVISEKVLQDLSAAEPHREFEFTIASIPKANGDRDLIEIVLTNLLGNAWKYSSKMDTIMIELGVIDKADQLFWYVRDNGAGFDMSRKDLLFKAFGRLHDNKSFQGTGIGLTTVQRIIQRHGGEILVEAVEGQGATFSFHFGA